MIKPQNKRTKQTYHKINKKAKHTNNKTNKTIVQHKTNNNTI